MVSRPITTSLGFLAASIFLSASASAADLYVAPTGSDSNSGTSAAPFRTIGKAASAATPGTTVHVAAGGYTGPVTTRASGTSSAPITYQSTTLHGAKVYAASDWTWTNYGSHVTIDGFDVSGGGQGGIGSLGSYVTIKRNLVHDIAAPVCGADGGAGIDAGNYLAIDTDIVDNIVHDIGWKLGECNTVHGLYHSHRGGTIANNIVYRVAGCGIHLWHNPSFINISNNLSFSNLKCGIVVGTGDAPNYGSVPVDNITVVNNIVMDNPIGIIEEGPNGPNNRYLNNILFRNADNIEINDSSTSIGSIYHDPQLVSYKADGGGDYHLAAGSPAIDAGTFTAAPDDDFDGRARPQGGGFDIGPYELSQAPSSQDQAPSSQDQTASSQGQTAPCGHNRRRRRCSGNSSGG